MDINFLKNNGIEIDGALDILGDVETYNDILNEFLEVSKERMPRIESTKNNDDMENYAIDVHALKSDSKYLGFTKLAEMALEHQLKAQDNDIDYVNSHYDELIDEFNKMVSISSEYLNNKM